MSWKFEIFATNVYHFAEVKGPQIWLKQVCFHCNMYVSEFPWIGGIVTSASQQIFLELLFVWLFFEQFNFWAYSVINNYLVNGEHLKSKNLHLQPRGWDLEAHEL